MTDQNLKLASEFPEASYDAWKELAEAALKGASFEKKLVTKTADGFSINPLYTFDSFDPESSAIHDTMVASQTRQAGKLADKSGWDIRQLHAYPDPVYTNTAILEDLENGATSVHLVFDAAAQSGSGANSESAGEGGVMLYSASDVATALKGVLTTLAPVSITAGAATVAASALVASESDADALLELNYDPIGTLAASGSLPTNLDVAVEEAGNFAKEVAMQFPKATAINVNSAPWFNAGATDATELAIALATGTCYLRAMTNAGMSVPEAAQSMSFTMAVGTDFFTGIAKLRALRLTWQRILEACGEANGAININAVSAEHVLSKVDPWVNMLRTTVTSFAAGVGAADSITCLPFDHSLGFPDSFSRRIARNTQLILEEESNIHRIMDPAGGSWYIENLTKELAETAWKKFQAMEAEGGITAKVLDGSLAADIETMWKAQAARIATRREPLTGVSEFPNIDEEPVTPEVPDLGVLRQQAQERQTATSDSIGSTFAELVAAAKAGANIEQLFQALYANSEAAAITPLPQHRLAEDYEALRDRALAHKAETGTEPQIFLANIGRVAEHTARATFARNFFEAGGIKAISNNGFNNSDDLIEAYKASGANLVAICGTDNQYEELAEDFAKKLKAAGAKRVYLAGNPGDKKSTYESAGVQEFIFVGANVLDICAEALNTLGVK